MCISDRVVALVGVSRVELRNEPTALEPYPQEATAWMHAEGLLGPENRVISRDVVGNYLEFAYGPDEARVFIDDRVDMFPIEVVRWYVGLIDVAGEYERIVAESDPTAVLWDCLLYTSDAADEGSRLDLGGCRIYKKRMRENNESRLV